MSFISFAFMVFLPCAVLCNFIVPIKYRYIWLLIASMIFYSTAGLGAVIILVLSMLSVYATGISLGKNKTKLIFLLCLIFNLGILFVFKYFNFFMQILGIATDGEYGNIQLTNIIIPLGLSFYILKAVGYLIDVYRGDIEPEKNFLKLALFVSFFPQIVAGPIEGACNMLEQFDLSLRKDLPFLSTLYLIPTKPYAVRWLLLQSYSIHLRSTRILRDIHILRSELQGFSELMS